MGRKLRQVAADAYCTSPPFCQRRSSISAARVSVPENVAAATQIISNGLNLRYSPARRRKQAHASKHRQIDDPLVVLVLSLRFSGNALESGRQDFPLCTGGEADAAFRATTTRGLSEVTSVNSPQLSDAESSFVPCRNQEKRDLPRGSGLALSLFALSYIPLTEKQHVRTQPARR